MNALEGVHVRPDAIYTRQGLWYVYNIHCMCRPSRNGMKNAFNCHILSLHVNVTLCIDTKSIIIIMALYYNCFLKWTESQDALHGFVCRY